MALTDKITNSVYVNLKKIDYRSFNGDKGLISIKDSYQVNSLLSSEISITFTRNTSVDMKTGFTLSIEVELKRFAADGVDLNEYLTEETVDQNIDELCSPVTNYVSLLIAQVTSSFNRQPIITPPNFVRE